MASVGYGSNPSNGVVGLNQPAGIEAAAWLRQLITKGISPQAVTNFAEQEALQSFKVGDAAFMRNWPYAWAELQKSDSRVRARLVYHHGGQGLLSTATLGSWGLALLKGSAHRDAAANAIRFLTSEKAQKQLFLENGYTPTIEALFNDPELVSINPTLPELAEALDHTKSRPETPLCPAERCASTQSQCCVDGRSGCQTGEWRTPHSPPKQSCDQQGI